MSLRDFKSDSKSHKNKSDFSDDSLSMSQSLKKFGLMSSQVECRRYKFGSWGFNQCLNLSSAVKHLSRKVKSLRTI